MIIFLYGDDSFRSHQKLSEIKAKYLASDKSGSGLSVFDSEEESDMAQKISRVLSMPNLLAPKRLMIVKNAILILPDREQKEILDCLKNNLDNLAGDKNTVAVFWENNQPKKSNALFKFLEKNSKKQAFGKLTGIKLSQWVMKTMQEIDPRAKISKLALEKLIVYCQENNFLLFSETRKLVDYSDGEMISEQNVEELVNARFAGNIFAMVDALGGNQKKEALKLIHEHLEKGDDPFYLMNMFAYQFRNLLKVADLKENGAFSEYEIAKITKMHPFVIRKNLSQIRNFSLEKLKLIYQKLSQLDTKIKTGRIEIKLALDKFVAEL